MRYKNMEMQMHSWTQQKLSPLNPLNILSSINGPLLSFEFNGLNNYRMQLTKIEQSMLSRVKKN